MTERKKEKFGSKLVMKETRAEKEERENNLKIKLEMIEIRKNYWRRYRHDSSFHSIDNKVTLREEKRKKETKERKKKEEEEREKNDIAKYFFSLSTYYEERKSRKEANEDNEELEDKIINEAWAMLATVLPDIEKPEEAKPLLTEDCRKKARKKRPRVEDEVEEEVLEDEEVSEERRRKKKAKRTHFKVAK